MNVSLASRVTVLVLVLFSTEVVSGNHEGREAPRAKLDVTARERVDFLLGRLADPKYIDKKEAEKRLLELLLPTLESDVLEESAFAAEALEQMGEAARAALEEAKKKARQPVAAKINAVLDQIAKQPALQAAAKKSLAGPKFDSKEWWTAVDAFLLEHEIPTATRARTAVSDLEPERRKAVVAYFQLKKRSDVGLVRITQFLEGRSDELKSLAKLDPEAIRALKLATAAEIRSRRASVGPGESFPARGNNTDILEHDHTLGDELLNAEMRRMWKTTGR